MTWEEIAIAGRLIAEAKGLIKPAKIPDIDDSMQTAERLGYLEEG